MIHRFSLAIVTLLLLAPRLVAEEPRLVIDEAKIAAAGIRKLPPAKRLILYTDLPSSPEIDGLPALFDRAFPQWCEYFHVSSREHANWQMTGFLMQDKARFRQAGLLPDWLPDFLHGFSVGYHLWLYEKPTDYYRRHLLLHEGTHGFMNTTLGGCGPSWYMEGTAELMATHRLKDGRLALNVMPAGREEVPDWGRIRIIKDAFAQQRAKRLQSVIEYSSTAHRQTEPYAWCWAAAILLDRHPRYRDRFHELSKDVLRPDFNQRFYRLFAADWNDLCEQWAVFIAGLEYGHDIERTAIDFRRGTPCPAAGAEVEVAADRGWQNSGLRVETGKSYRLTAAGRYQVGTQPKVWWCEPGGISIRYYQGRPLGILLAAVRPDAPAEKGLPALLRPSVVGLGTTLQAETAGTLFFKINHSAGELAGNAGQLTVRIQLQ